MQIENNNSAEIGCINDDGDKEDSDSVIIPDDVSSLQDEGEGENEKLMDESNQEKNNEEKDNKKSATS